MPARSGTGAPPEGCTCLLGHAIVNNVEAWSVHETDPSCPHHGTPPRDDLYDGRMPLDDDD